MGETAFWHPGQVVELPNREDGDESDGTDGAGRSYREDEYELLL